MLQLAYKKEVGSLVLYGSFTKKDSDDKNHDLYKVGRPKFVKIYPKI